MPDSVISSRFGIDELTRSVTEFSPCSRNIFEIVCVPLTKCRSAQGLHSGVVPWHDGYGHLFPWRARCPHVSRSRHTGKSISASSTLYLLASRIWMCHCKQSSLFPGSRSSQVSCWRRRRVQSVVQAGDPRALDVYCYVEALFFAEDRVSLLTPDASCARHCPDRLRIMECDVGSRC